MSWLAFKTQSSDMRTCGMNVQPSSATAVMTRWTAGASAAGASAALSSLTLTCAGSVLQSLASVTFAATMPAFQSLGYGIPADCTPVFSAPAINVSAMGNVNFKCKTWVATAAGKTAAAPNTTNPCPCECWGGLTELYTLCLPLQAAARDIGTLCTVSAVSAWHACSWLHTCC